MSKMDDCNSLYVSLPNYLLRKLYSVINRLTRLIYSLPPCVPLLVFLLPHILLNCIGFLSRQELNFKICLLAFKALKFIEPKYLADLLNLSNVHVGMGLKTSRDSL